MITVWIFLGCVALAILLANILIPWQVHREMTRDCTPIQGFGTFEEFKQEFESRIWFQSKHFKGSFFVENDRSSEYHANIVSFGGRGMLLSIVGYWRARRYTGRLTEKRNPSRRRWSELEDLKP